jgi:hypothetical protein
MKYVIKAEEALLKQTGRLSSHPHIFCVKCEGKTTAFGSNLQNKIQKAGSLGDLLSTFECRSCRNAGKPQRLPKAPKRKRKETKAYRKQVLLKDLPKMVFAERKPIVLLDNPEFTAQVTAFSCQRPDVFLDSNRSCDFCSLYEICKAPNRRLSSQGWQARPKLAA